MINKRKVCAIILCAGNSKRYGKNKILEQINGKYVINYSLEIFDSNKFVDEIIVGIREEDKKIFEQVIKKNKYHKKIILVIGGNTRSETVYICLKETNSDIVIIHDGARPNIRHEFINNLLNYMNQYVGTTLGVKAKDTIKLVDDENNILSSTNRNNTYLIQTPQCFIRKYLLEKHRLNNSDITDDCILLEGDYKIKVIEGDYTNIKITTLSDLNILKEYMK